MALGSLGVTVDIEGDLKTIARDISQSVTGAVFAAVNAAGEDLKTQLRGQIQAAGLGQRLAQTWQGRFYPNSGSSRGPAYLAYSKAPNIVRAFNDGTPIRSPRGLYLAIPSDAVPRSARGGHALTPGALEQRLGRRLRFIYRRGAPSLLVLDQLRARQGKHGGFALASATALKSGTNLASAVMFILVPQVLLRKRLNVEDAAYVAGGNLQARIAGELAGI